MKKIILTLLIMSVAFILSAQTLTMGADDATKMYYPVVAKILSEAGYSSELNVQPGGRSISSANSGELDGEIWRIESIQGKFPNLMPVPTPLKTLDFKAYYMLNGSVINSEADMKGKKIGTMRGNKAAEGYLASVDNEVIYALNPENLLKLLESNRVDVVIADVAFRGRSQNPEAIGTLETPLVSTGVHIWLNKKHSALIPSIDGVIQNWGSAKMEGELQAVTKK
ncbi:MAG: transporter substrate-binding domain-containing protein [Spirochaetales bacterium]|nr:transporter substrate-binding domain-containing protein [Spirochaetales bacterium]